MSKFPWCGLVLLIGLSTSVFSGTSADAGGPPTKARAPLTTPSRPRSLSSDHGLVEAARSGSVHRVASLLDRGADINARDEGGYTALIAAAEAGRQGVVSLLLDQGADVNAHLDENLNALMFEAETGPPKLVARLLGRGADVNFQGRSSYSANTALLRACRRADPEVVRLLVRWGARVNAAGADRTTPLIESAFQGDVASVRLLLARGAAVEPHDFEGNTALFRAVMGPPSYRLQTGRVDIMRSLIAAGADWKRRGPGGGTLLMEAVAAEHIDAIRYLLRLGADVNAATPTGDTALMAVPDVYSTKELLVTNLLLSAGADVNRQGHEHKTALMEAVYLGSDGVVRRLLEAHARVNMRDDQGWTALMWAINRDRPHVVAMLLGAGADVHLGDGHGATPWTIAQEAGGGRVGQARILALLRRAGADTQPRPSRQ